MRHLSMPRSALAAILVLFVAVSAFADDWERRTIVRGMGGIYTQVDSTCTGLSGQTINGLCSIVRSDASAEGNGSCCDYKFVKHGLNSNGEYLTGQCRIDTTQEYVGDPNDFEVTQWHIHSRGEASARGELRVSTGTYGDIYKDCVNDDCATPFGGADPYYGDQTNSHARIRAKAEAVLTHSGGGFGRPIIVNTELRKGGPPNTPTVASPWTISFPPSVSFTPPVTLNAPDCCAYFDHWEIDENSEAEENSYWEFENNYDSTHPLLQPWVHWKIKGVSAYARLEIGAHSAEVQVRIGLTSTTFERLEI